MKIFGKNVDAGDAVAGYATGGLSAIDKATGDNVGKGLRNARSAITGVFDKPKMDQFGAPDANALQKVDPDKYSQMPQGASAPQIEAAKANAAQINLADPRWAVLAHGPQEQFRNQQSALAGQLAQQAAGVGPSVAQNQMRQAAAANQAATFAQLASARGGANPALARQAMESAANTGNKLAVDAGTARLQEQMQAAGLLGQVAQGARGQDIGIANTQAGLAQSQAGMEQQTNLANMQAQQQAAIENAQQQSQFQQLQQKYASMGMDAARANQMAALEFEKMRSGTANMNTQAQNQAAAAQKAFQQKLFGQALGTGASAAMMGAGAPPTAAAPAANPFAGGGYGEPS